MSESSANNALVSLQRKNCIQIIQTEHKGRRLHLFLPKEIEGIFPKERDANEISDIENMDFFTDPLRRVALLKRENYRCFYSLKKIDENSFVLGRVLN